MNEQDRDQLFRFINEVSFAMHDAALFLDTHPHDDEALAFFHKYRCMREEAINEYTNCFGPLTKESVISENEWTWVCEKWPWEGGC